MSIQVQCVQCGTSHQVNDRLAGRRVRCPECDTAIHVPELAVAAAPADDSVEVEVVEAEPVEIVEPAGPVEASPVEAAGTQLETGAVPAAVAPGIPTDEEDSETFLARPKREEDELDMTPMVDVTFLLLIFFMVTASFSLQKSIEMPRQQTDAPSTQAVDEDPEELDQVEVQIDEFGGFLVLAADWEAETPGKQNLISKLREAKVAEAAKLIIKVHEEARLQSLVDGMDAGTIAGYAEIQVTQVDQFD
jgi:biopolymer transport protein ExbD